MHATDTGQVAWGDKGGNSRMEDFDVSGERNCMASAMVVLNPFRDEVSNELGNGWYPKLNAKRYCIFRAVMSL